MCNEIIKQFFRKPPPLKENVAWQRETAAKNPIKEVLIKEVLIERFCCCLNYTIFLEPSRTLFSLAWIQNFLIFLVFDLFS